MKPRVVLCDVIETLLDTTPLTKRVNWMLDSKRGFRIWFGMLLQYSLVENSIGRYHDFPSIAGATLDMAATAMGKEINEEEKKEALGLITRLSAHEDVAKGLKLIKEAGFRLATLTNSPPKTQMAQLEHAGIASWFEKMLSVDAVKKYKPATEAYRYAANELGVPANEVVMVAAHGWDIAGALQAGMQAAFIGRKGQSLYPLSPKPMYVGQDLVAIAEALNKL